MWSLVKSKCTLWTCANLQQSNMGYKLMGRKEASL